MNEIEDHPPVSQDAPTVPDYPLEGVLLNERADPALYAWLGGADLILADGSHHTRKVKHREVEKIRGLLRELWASGDHPDVVQDPDTSSGWFHLSLTFFEDGKTRNLELPLRLSGFCGRDAQGLETALRAMTELVGASQVPILRWLQRSRWPPEE